MSGSLAAPPQGDDRRDAVIGGCQLIRRLDTRGSCATYLARQLQLGNRLVVVKLVQLRTSTSQPDQARELQARLLRHARALGQLSHPNILPLYDAGIAHGQFYLVTQHVPDGSLASALRGTAPRGRLSLPARPLFVADLIAQVAAALHYLHTHGLVHGAVEPGSVLLHAQPDSRWLALLADAGPPAITENIGAAPAVAVTPADDQAALAALAYLLLAGRALAAPDALAAEPAATEAAAPDHAAMLRAANPEVPGAAVQAIARALAPDPDARFPTVAAFAQEFMQAFDQVWKPSGQDVWASPSRPARPTTPPTAPSTSAPLPPRLERKRARSAPRPVRVGDPRDNRLAGRHLLPARRHPWRRTALGLAGLALLLGALVLALRLPDSGTGPVTAANQNAGQQVGVAGGQLAVAGGTAAPTASIAAAAPPPTPIRQGDRAILIAQPAALTAAPGQPFAASFILLNSGDSTWSAAGGYGLICDRMRHPEASCPGDTWIGFGSYVIAPGQQVKFTVDLIAPADPGTYLLWWNLAHAGRIFPSPDVALRVVVPLPPLTTPTSVPSTTPTIMPSVSPSITPSATPDSTV